MRKKRKDEIFMAKMVSNLSRGKIIEEPSVFPHANDWI